MDNQLTTANKLVASQQDQLKTVEEQMLSVLQSTIYPGAKLDSVKMVLAYCRARELDPLFKPVHIVPMSVKNAETGRYDFRDVVLPGIGLYRIQASRTGQHVGTSEPEFGEEVTEKIDGVEITYPLYCITKVYRLVDEKICEFTAKEFWKENYATAGKDSIAPNAMWKKRPYAQLAKCTEAQALRKGFPEVGSQPTAEEMEGKVIDYDIESADVPSKTATAKIGEFKNILKQAEEAPVIAEAKEILEENLFKKFSDKLEKAKNLGELKTIAADISKSNCEPGEKTKLRSMYSIRHDEIAGVKS